MTQTPEREPEHRDVPFDTPPGIHENEPPGDNTPAPDADMSGDPIAPDAEGSHVFHDPASSAGGPA